MTIIPKIALVSCWIMLLFFSCNTAVDSTPEDGGLKEVNTADVKGEIDLQGASAGSLSYSYNGNGFDAYKVKLDKTAAFIIYPTPRSFEEEKTTFEKKAKGKFDKFKILKVEGDCIFYSESKVPFADFNKKDSERVQKEGFGFVRILKKDDQSNYIIKSNGDSPLDPIWSKEDAEKLYAIAKNFKAK